MLYLFDYIGMTKEKIINFSSQNVSAAKTELQQDLNTLATNVNIDINTINSNIDTLETYATSNVFKQESSTFVGGGGERTIAHGISFTPSYVNGIPIVNTSGYLGEVWVRKNATNIYVGNTGSSTVAFNWVDRKQVIL